jgi:acyl-CoA synthetase (AMP-forming)/AMP-acid ligase II
VLLSACPLMHGTGQFSSLIAMNLGGCVVSLPSRHFDVDELLGEVQRNRVNSVIIVGQAFAGPMLEHLDAHPGRYDLSSVRHGHQSSGVMWSHDNKQGLLRHLPQAALFDSFGSSEAVGMGASVSTADGASQTARFQLGPNCVVFTEDGRRVATGLGRARPGLPSAAFIPVGYYKDEVKSAARPSAPSRTGAGACPATGPRSPTTAPCCCWAAARCASTPAARRCFPRRWRKR